MKTDTMKSMWRILVPVMGAITLAACQQTAPKRSSATPDSGAPAAAAATMATSAAPASAASAPAATPSASVAPIVTFHLAQARPSEGLARVQINPETALYAVPQPVFTQADLQQVVPVQSNTGQVFLNFEFNQAGAAKLAQVTREAVGNYLLLSIRGRLVAVPQITAAQENGRLPVEVGSAEAAQSIVQMLRQPAG